MDIIESRSYHLYAWTQEHKEKVMNEDGTEEYLDKDYYRDSSWTLSFYYLPSTIFGVYDFSAFLISFIFVNVVLVVLVFIIYILLDHEASVFHSIVVLLGHVIMAVSPILCIITIVASLFVRRIDAPKTDESAQEISKSRSFWTPFFVLVASIPMLPSMLFSALRVGEAIRYGTVLYDYKYAGWYSDLTDRRSVNYSTAAVQYLRASNIMPSLHDIFPMWYMCSLILLFQPIRSQLLSACQRYKTKAKISSPSTGCSTDAVVSIEPPIQNQVPQ